MMDKKKEPVKITPTIEVSSSSTVGNGFYGTRM